MTRLEIAVWACGRWGLRIRRGWASACGDCLQKGVETACKRDKLWRRVVVAMYGVSLGAWVIEGIYSVWEDYSKVVSFRVNGDWGEME